MTTTIRILGALAMLWAVDAAADWRPCAKENGYCRFEGRRDVQYGAGSKWITKTFTGGVKCDNNTFGDPLQGKEKSCRVSTVQKQDPVALPEVTSAWTRCAGEGGVRSKPEGEMAGVLMDANLRSRSPIRKSQGTQGSRCFPKS